MNPYTGAFDHVLFYGRTYAEVIEMLALRDEDLRGRKVLDCPSGPDAFVADAAQRGFYVTGCDPMYDGKLEDIVAQGRRDILAGWEVGRKAGKKLGGLDVDDFHKRKLEALDVFAADFELGRKAGRYVAAALPNLPFPDRSFDLVISANFLFAYASGSTGGLTADGRFDLEFHRRSVAELVRVCRGEVRMYPVVRIDENRQLHAYAAQIIGQLAADGHNLGFLETEYVQQHASGHLVLTIECD